MKPSYDQALEPLLRRLSAAEPVSEHDKAILAELPWTIEEKPARKQFVQEGDRPSQCCLLLSGVVVRSRFTRDGARQILSVHIPGDMPDLQSLRLRRMDHALETISACRIAYVSHGALNHACEQSFSLAKAFWREGLIDSALHRGAIFRNAQLDSESRLANFLSEMHLRHLAVGLLDEDGFAFPMSQEAMGEALGLTVVSINRAAQNLRSKGLVRMDRGSIQVLNEVGLGEFGQFDPTFLHLREGSL